MDGLVRRSGTYRAFAPVVVALPVKNEEDCLAACLDALDSQVGGRADHILLLLNNCSDRSASVARSLQPRLISELHVMEVRLAPHQANAGYARRLALEAAYRLAGESGVLMTTDADGRVDPDWVANNLAAIRAGADAVAGWAEIDPLDWGSIPLALHENDARECAYDAACDEIHGLLDPDPADPLPRHTQASGASIAVTAKAYRAAGGMPTVPSGEDRAFIAALRRNDARVRHAPECRVVVSGRTEGRAAGGMADTIRRRLRVPDRFLDDRLEPARDCARRAALRWLARRAHAGDPSARGLHLLLGLDEEVVRASLRKQAFGAAWAELEEASSRLVSRRVDTACLPEQQRCAEALRDEARRDAASCRHALLRSTTPAE